MERITDLRQQIDAIDNQIIPLFISRMELSSQMAAAKRQAGLPIADPTREAAVLARLEQLAGPPWQDYCHRLYQTLFALSKDYQRQLLAATAEGPA